MKKLLLILLLFVAYNCYSQGLTLNGSLNSSSVQGTGLCNSTSGNSFLNVPANPVSYNARAKEFFARVEALGKTLTTAQKQWYNDSIFVLLTNDGLIGATRAGDSLVALYAFCGFANGTDSTIMNMNLLADQYNCIHYGGVTYTDSGVIRTASGGYLNTFFNPVADSTIYKLNSASYGLYSKTDVNESTVDMGAYKASTSRSHISARFTGLAAYRTNQDGANTQTTANSLGIYISVRQASNLISGYKNGVSIVSGTTASTSITNNFFYICTLNDDGTASTTLQSSRLYIFAFIGSGLSTTKATALSNDLNNSLKGRNYNVY